MNIVEQSSLFGHCPKVTELFPDHELLASRQLQSWKTWKTQYRFGRTFLRQWGILPSDTGRVWSLTIFLFAYLWGNGQQLFFFTTNCIQIRKGYLSMLLALDTTSIFERCMEYLQDFWICLCVSGGLIEEKSKVWGVSLLLLLVFACQWLFLWKVPGSQVPLF